MTISKLDMVCIVPVVQTFVGGSLVVAYSSKVAFELVCALSRRVHVCVLKMKIKVFEKRFPNYIDSDPLSYKKNLQEKINKINDISLCENLDGVWYEIKLNLLRAAPIVGSVVCGLRIYSVLQPRQVNFDAYG